MSSRSLKEEARLLVEHWVEAANTRRDAAVIDEFLTPGFVWHLPGGDVQGRDAVKAVFARAFADEPDFRLVAETVVTDGEWVVVRWTIRGTPRDTGQLRERASITMDWVRDGRFADSSEPASSCSTFTWTSLVLTDFV